MSTDYSILLEQYPEVVSKDQMYKICHISKRKATWLQRILFSLHSVTSNFLSVLMNGFISNNVAMCLLQTINPPQNGKEFTQ